MQPNNFSANIYGGNSMAQPPVQIRTRLVYFASNVGFNKTNFLFDNINLFLVIQHTLVILVFEVQLQKNIHRHLFLGKGQLLNWQLQQLHWNHCQLLSHQNLKSKNKTADILIKDYPCNVGLLLSEKCKLFLLSIVAERVSQVK